MRVLVAPLNWGLGHAARCVPIIQALIDEGCEVFLASDGGALHLLKEHFSQLPHAELPSYDITYPQHLSILQWLNRVPRLLDVIQRENLTTKRIADRWGIDFIISDNRYGVYKKRTPSVVITHQLRINVPPFSGLVSRRIRGLLHRFDECWIPDYEDPSNLTGALSAPDLQITKRYLGPLTRFEVEEHSAKYEVAAILSGPEPDRSRFEQSLHRQLQTLPGRSVLVSGINTSEPVKYLGNLTIYPALHGKKLNKIINQSQWVICRAGYTSIMDLTLLGKKALLVPTPRQPEQQYLAQRMRDRSGFVVQSEKALDLVLAKKRLDRENLPTTLGRSNLNEVLKAALQI